MSWWCKVGVHDYEDIDDRKLIKEAIEALMEKRLFKRESQSYPQRWIALPGRPHEGIVLSQDGVFNRIPINPHTSVCMKCGKITKSYDLDEILRSVERMIDFEQKAMERQKTAVTMRQSAQVRDTYKA